MKVEDIRPAPLPEPPAAKIRFRLVYKREYDLSFLDADDKFHGDTTEEAIARLQEMVKDYSSLEDMMDQWEILEGPNFDDGFELDVEVIIPGQKRLI